jgi:hypothetical protein
MYMHIYIYIHTYIYSSRNPHQCLYILDDIRPGNLLAHFPLNSRSVFMIKTNQNDDIFDG